MPSPTFHMISGAPTPVAPFSHAVETDGWLFVTGQMPTWPDDDTKPLPQGIEAQTRRVMGNLILGLEGAGYALPHRGVGRLCLTRLQGPYARMNRGLPRHFPRRQAPARPRL